VLLHTSLSGLQDRYGHYIQEQRDIESVLKRVVQVVVPVIEEPAKLELRDDFEKTNETLYARFKVDELNRSLYLYHGPLQQQTSPPMSHRRTITTVTGKKASVLEAESVEETTAMITPNQ
jgi:hypothetical protein